MPETMQARESCLCPADGKPDLFYEARRKQESPPGVSHDCLMSLPCVSPVDFIGLAYATECE